MRGTPKLNNARHPWARSLILIHICLHGPLKNQPLKFYEPIYYTKNSLTIKCAILGLSLTLMFRGIIDCIMALNVKFENHIKQNEALYNIFMHLIFIFLRI